jgi:hypothetical protein
VLARDIAENQKFCPRFWGYDVFYGVFEEERF